MAALSVEHAWPHIAGPTGVAVVVRPKPPQTRPSVRSAKPDAQRYYIIHPMQ